MLIDGGLRAWVRGAPPFWENPVQIAAILLAVVAILVPAVRERLARWIGCARQPSLSDARMTAVVIGVVVFLYLAVTAYWQGRGLVPGGHDEHLYLLQARFLSTGRLWTAAHPMADFFETFYVFNRPVYAPMYFPGTALLYLPWGWFGIPAWFVAGVVGATAAALAYRVIGQLLDGAAGIVAALLVPALQQFRVNTMMAMSHTAMLMLGLLATWAWLCWRRTSRGPAMAAVVGAAMGWALITRPIDALCYALPIGVAMLLDVRGQSPRRRVTVLGAGALGAAPLLALQCVLNVGVTGSLLRTPVTLYNEREWPGLNFTGFTTLQPDAKPASSLPQKHDLYNEIIRPRVALHRPDNLLKTWLTHRAGVIAAATLPNSLLIIPFMAGVLGVWTNRRWVLSNRRWVLLLTLPLFVAGYAFNPFLLFQYPLTVVPAVLMTVMASFRVAERLWPRAGAFVGVLSVVLPLGLALGTLPELNAKVNDTRSEMPLMHWVYNELPAQVQQPALVLFKYRSGVDNVHEEPVSNLDVVNVDDAPIIKAHDLGPTRNAEIIRYYAERQPNRRVYLCERATRTLTDLGQASDAITNGK